MLINENKENLSNNNLLKLNYGKIRNEKTK